jgi:hypothetical protein
MYRNTLSAAMLLLSLNVSAQVTSPLLNCVDILKKNFQFTAIFNGQTATVTFKGWTYDLRFTDGSVSPDGERWSYYKNKEIEVGTTFPLDKYVTVHSLRPRSPIARSYCK